MICPQPYINDDYQKFPCGKCAVCLARRSAGWIFRLQKEAEASASAFFITYTYDWDSVPFTKTKQLTLKKRHLQLYMKKLRKISATKLKYYACGEYGTKLKRPHYHMILINASLQNIIGKSMADHCALNPGIMLNGKFKFKATHWQHGFITIGIADTAAIAYTTKYINKGKTVPEGPDDDRQQEFSIMSKKIGMQYINDQVKKWHTKNKKELSNRYYLPGKGVEKTPMPRYYKEKIYTEYQRQHIAAQLIRKEAEKTREEKEEDKNKIANLERKAKICRQKKFI